MQQRGFSLVEMMIVVAIIVILGNIAVPTYQKYTQRAKYTELFTEITAARTAIELCAQLGELELSAPENCLSSTTHHTSSIAIATRTQGNSIWILSHFTDSKKSGPLKAGVPNLTKEGADAFVASFQIELGELLWQQGCLGKHAVACPVKNTLFPFNSG